MASSNTFTDTHKQKVEELTARNQQDAEKFQAAKTLLEQLISDLEDKYRNAQEKILQQNQEAQALTQKLSDNQTALATARNTIANTPTSTGKTRVAEGQTDESDAIDQGNEDNLTITQHELRVISDTVKRYMRQHEFDKEQLASQQVPIAELSPDNDAQIHRKKTDDAKFHEKCKALEREVERLTEIHQDDEYALNDITILYDSSQQRVNELQQQLDDIITLPVGYSREHISSPGSKHDENDGAKCQEILAEAQKDIGWLENDNEKLRRQVQGLEGDKHRDNRIIQGLRGSDFQKWQHAHKEYAKMMEIERDRLATRLNQRYGESEMVQALGKEVNELQKEVYLAKQRCDHYETVAMDELVVAKDFSDVKRELEILSKDTDDCMMLETRKTELEQEVVILRAEIADLEKDNAELRKNCINKPDFDIQSLELEDSRRTIERLMDIIIDLEDEIEDLKDYDLDDPNDADYSPESEYEAFPSVEEDSVDYCLRCVKSLQSQLELAVDDPIMTGFALREAYEGALQLVSALTNDRDLTRTMRDHYFKFNKELQKEVKRLRKALDQCHRHGKALGKEIKRLSRRNTILEGEVDFHKGPKCTPPSRPSTVRGTLAFESSSPPRREFSGGDPPRKRRRPSTLTPSSPAITRAEVHNPESTVRSNPARHGRALIEVLPGSPYKSALAHVLRRAHELLDRRADRDGRRQVQKSQTPRTPIPTFNSGEYIDRRDSSPFVVPMQRIELHTSLDRTRARNPRSPSIMSQAPPNPADDVFVDRPKLEYNRAGAPEPEARREPRYSPSNLPSLGYFPLGRKRKSAQEIDNDDLPFTKRRRIIDISRDPSGSEGACSKRNVSFQVYEDSEAAADREYDPTSPVFDSKSKSPDHHQSTRRDYGSLAPPASHFDPITGEYRPPPRKDSNISPKSWTSSEKRRGDDLPDYESDPEVRNPPAQRRQLVDENWAPDFEKLSPRTVGIWRRINPELFHEEPRRTAPEGTEPKFSSPSNASEASTIIIRRDVPKLVNFTSLIGRHPSRKCLSRDDSSGYIPAVTYSERMAAVVVDGDRVNTVTADDDRVTSNAEHHANLNSPELEGSVKDLEQGTSRKRKRSHDGTDVEVGAGEEAREDAMVKEEKAVEPPKKKAKGARKAGAKKGGNRGGKGGDEEDNRDGNEAPQPVPKKRAPRRKPATPPKRTMVTRSQAKMGKK